MPRFTEKEQVLILKYFELEKEAGQTLLPISAVRERVAEALGISLPTIRRLVNEGVQKDSDYSITMSQSVATSRKPTLLINKYEHAIRMCVYRMFSKDWIDWPFNMAIVS
ncbi:uncharacterized protein [Diabrotica undecimpunctata]|uniref:uncharacterized protein isoform X3 n=1 Tax=Diabrotica undecimpunctata TaxID=50387 RepID=UPI003B63FF56